MTRSERRKRRERTNGRNSPLVGKKRIEGYKGPARENKKRGSVVTSIKSGKGSTGHPRKILHEHLARFLWAWKHSKSCVALPPCRHFTLFVGVCCVKCPQLMNWFFESKERILIFVSSVQIEINSWDFIIFHSLSYLSIDILPWVSQKGFGSLEMACYVTVLYSIEIHPQLIM